MMLRPAALGIGTAAFLPQYGLGADPVPERSLLQTAVERGVGYLDTAADYGDGELAVACVRRDGIRVCTKVKPSASLDDVRASIARLSGRVDTILMHSAGRGELASAAAVAALVSARDAGLTSRIGASTYGVGDALFALSLPWVDVVQVEYSVLNQSVLRALGSRDRTKEVVVRSVLCKGLLTSRRSTAPHLVAPVRDALDGLQACADEWGRGIEELAIRFALDAEGVDVVLVGVSRPDELETALAAAASPPLTPAQWDRLATFDRSAIDAVHPERWSRIPS